MNGPRAADDFATIRARLEELRREREHAMPSVKNAQRDLPLPRDGASAGRCQRPTRGREGFTHLALVLYLGSVWDL